MARISYATGTALGSHLRSTINSIVTLKAEMARIQIAMDVATNADPSPRDYTKLEDTIFGAAPGEGEALYNMVTSINTLMQNVAATFLAAVDNG